MAAIWDPERLLDIRGSAMFHGGIQCHGANGGYGPRCRWTKGRRDDERPDVREADALLQTMATQPPSNVTAQSLQRLAELCLCRDHHWNDRQRDTVAGAWAELIRQAVSRYASTPAPVPVHVPVPVPVPTTPLVATPQFNQAQWQSTNWHTTLASQVGSVADSSSSQSTNGAQHQHADAPAGLTWSRRSPSRERTESELTATLARLSALQIQNEDLRKQEQRLKALDSEYSEFRDRTETQLAVRRTELAALQGENRDLQQEEQRLRALHVEHSRSSQRTSEALAATQKQLSTLQIENKNLLEQQDRLKTLESEYSSFKARSEAELRAAAEKLAQALADKEQLRAEKDMDVGRKAVAGGEYRALEQKERETSARLRQRDADLQALADRHRALEQTERNMQALVQHQHAELHRLRTWKQQAEVAESKRGLDAAAQQRGAEPRDALRLRSDAGVAAVPQEPEVVVVTARPGSGSGERTPRPWARRVRGLFKRLRHRL
ncbi:reticulocyte-binding protein 2 a [Parachaetomium inaequale]|uniref:Reticulocyte-binding protein 2 a n=1 Tax=Parachaetomium inaequale TaxID=2588326 RepID=A0AAN6SQN1_9PEZI|nr:reticulocyte-binding protein 2 a [Parachaetomium inaequale]